MHRPWANLERRPRVLAESRGLWWVYEAGEATERDGSVEDAERCADNGGADGSEGDDSEAGEGDSEVEGGDEWDEGDDDDERSGEQWELGEVRWGRDQWGSSGGAGNKGLIWKG